MITLDEWLLLRAQIAILDVRDWATLARPLLGSAFRLRGAGLGV